MAQIGIPELVSHSKRVCRLYKQALHNIRSWLPKTVDIRYESVMLRAEFDKNKNIKDLRLAKQLLEKGEKQLERCLHPQPLAFPTDPEGPAYNRVIPIRDWVLDYWDPIEKAMYPKYFAKREQRKKEYIEFYNREYGSKKQI